jgi:hypothetical protein
VRTFLLGLAIGMAWTIGECSVIVYRRFRQGKYGTGDSSELDALVRTERVTQAMPLVTLAVLNLPIDVKTLTITLHYNDGHHLVLDCGRPEHIEAREQ